MRILRNHVENGNFQKRSQKPAKRYVFQSGEKHKWMQMPMIKWKWASPEIEITRKNPAKSAKIEKSQNRFEINWNSILTRISAEKRPEKVTRFWQSTIYGQFWKMSKLEKWKILEFSSYLRVFLKHFETEIQQRQISPKSEKPICGKNQKNARISKYVLRPILRNS